MNKTIALEIDVTGEQRVADPDRGAAMSDYTTLLAPGTRVRNHGEQFPRAFREGTATHIECTQHYRDGTHEYRVRYDDGREVLLNYVHPVELH